jgi:hypothetical protein
MWLSDLRLELMDELFRVDNNNTSCHCCPDVRAVGLLGKPLIRAAPIWIVSLL